MLLVSCPLDSRYESGQVHTALGKAMPTALISCLINTRFQPGDRVAERRLLLLNPFNGFCAPGEVSSQFSDTALAASHTLGAIPRLSLLLLFIAGASAAPVYAQTKEDARNQMETATAALRGWDLDRAEAAANSLLSMTAASNDMRAVAFNILGIVSDQRQDVAKAESYYRKALAADPSLIAAHNNLGNLYFKSKKEQQAISEYQMVLRTDPANTEANLNLGLIYQSNGRLELAGSHLEKAREQAPGDARLALSLAGLYLDTKKTEKALAVIADLVKASNDDERVHFTV